MVAQLDTSQPQHVAINQGVTHIKKLVDRHSEKFGYELYWVKPRREVRSHTWLKRLCPKYGLPTHPSHYLGHHVFGF